jgi:hypothetical protein
MWILLSVCNSDVALRFKEQHDRLNTETAACAWDVSRQYKLHKFTSWCHSQIYWNDAKETVMCIDWWAIGYDTSLNARSNGWDSSVFPSRRTGRTICGSLSTNLPIQYTSLNVIMIMKLMRVEETQRERPHGRYNTWVSGLDSADTKLIQLQSTVNSMFFLRICYKSWISWPAEALAAFERVLCLMELQICLWFTDEVDDIDAIHEFNRTRIIRSVGLKTDVGQETNRSGVVTERGWIFQQQPLSRSWLPS